MPRIVPFVLILGGLTAATGFAAEPTLSDTAVFRFAPAVKDGPFAETDKPAGWTDTPTLRPNAAAVYHLYVFNPTPAVGTFVVEFDAGFKLQATVTDVPSMQWVRVKFTKPPAAPVTPATAPPVPAPATPPPAEPTPPGTELTRTANGFPVNIRLLQKDGTPLLDGEKVYGRRFNATLTEPKTYLTVENSDVTVAQKLAQVSLGFTPKDPAVPSTLKLSFPKPAGAAGPITRDGLYERTLAREPNSNATPKAVLKGSATDFGRTLRADVAVDGVKRAFIFEGTQFGLSKWQLSQSSEVAVRVFPATETASEVATKPVAVFPVRVEVDNPPDGATVELRYHRNGDSAADEKEVIRLGGPRNEQVWLDATDAGLAFATRSKDWVKSLNLADVRGQVIVEAELKYGGVTTTAGLVVIVDATAPDVSRLAFDNLKDGKRLEKGKPLALSAVGYDADTKIAKAVFFLGQPLDDGKLPPDAIQVPGRLKPPLKGQTESDVWTAALTLPADKRGEMTVGVILTDSAGNTSTPEVKRIELVDAPPPGPKPGSIEVMVMFGERPQPGQTVALIDGEGKPKKTEKTNDKGKATFENVPPGGYKLSVAKTDTTAGLTGAADVTVEPDKKAKATVELKKKR